MATLKELILQARRELEQAQIDDVIINADLLAASLLQVERGRLPLHWQNECENEFVERFLALVERRCRHEPLQYLLADWPFLDFTLVTRPGALIPRPETEEVFLALAEEIEQAKFKNQFSFVDICTGTGAIGLALIKRFPGALGWLSDISADAVAVAAENLARFAEIAQPRLQLLRADLLEAFAENSLDVIVANPPYIASHEIAALMPEVRDFEPKLALDGGGDGLDLIRKMLQQAQFCLRSDGLLAFEHGHGQRAAIFQILCQTSQFEVLQAGDDLCGCERFFILRLKQ